MNLLERKRLVIKMYLQGETRAKIAKATNFSFRTIEKIVNDHENSKSKSKRTQAYELFSASPQDLPDLLSVSIELDIGPDEVNEYHRDYLQVVNMNELARIYGDTKGKLGQFLDFYNELHLYNIDLDNIQEVRALANQIPQIKDEYHRLSASLGLTKNETQDQQQILSNIGNSISRANGQLSDLQSKIQNANTEINKKNEEILNFEQIQNSMKNSESYKELPQLALQNIQKYMGQRKNFLIAVLFITRNIMSKNPEFQYLLDPTANPYDLPLNEGYIHAAEAEFQELLMDIHAKEIMEVGYIMRGQKSLPDIGPKN
jgi:hypothetical protein